MTMTQKIAALIDEGREDEARRCYGDPTVDRFFAEEWGVDPDAMRLDPDALGPNAEFIGAGDTVVITTTGRQGVLVDVDEHGQALVRPEASAPGAEFLYAPVGDLVHPDSPIAAARRLREAGPMTADHLLRAAAGARLVAEGRVREVPGRVYVVEGDSATRLVAIAGPGVEQAPPSGCPCPSDRTDCSHARAARQLGRATRSTEPATHTLVYPAVLSVEVDSDGRVVAAWAEPLDATPDAVVAHDDGGPLAGGDALPEAEADEVTDRVDRDEIMGLVGLVGIGE